MIPSLVKQLGLNAFFGGAAYGFVQGAVGITEKIGEAAPSTFWQGFATLALTSLMTLGKWYFDDRKSSRANSDAIAQLQTQITKMQSDLTGGQALQTQIDDLRGELTQARADELTEARKPPRRRPRPR
jgi:hypothetical protein